MITHWWARCPIQWRPPLQTTKRAFETASAEARIRRLQALLAQHVQQNRRLRRWIAVGVAAGVGGGVLGYAYGDELAFAATAAARSGRAAATVLRIAGAYQLHSLRETLQPSATATEAQARLSDCHARCAASLFRLACANGGVYVKLGQHLGAMNYVLPDEYIRTMVPLQDQCPPSTLDEIDRMFRADTGQGLGDLFEEFDAIPLGVASLAQVHRARFHRPGRPQAERVPAELRGQLAAVKVQHPALAMYSAVDIRTCAALVRGVKWLFPSFEFQWLADELSTSLPRELDFTQEAANADQARALFDASGLPVRVPRVFWALPRILAMEFAEGSRVDDLAYLRKHRLKPHAIAAELHRAFNAMIFQYGFVHCDPHPGNLFVRPVRKGFELVLLDHGLYRTLQPAFREAYARLWIALISGNVVGIEAATRTLFELGEPVGGRPTPDFRLFASLLTGRPWDVIAARGEARNGERLPSVANRTTGSLGLASAPRQAESDRIQKVAANGRFFVRLADLLARVPRELLLLFKTNDLLRAVDASLGVARIGAGSSAAAAQANQIYMLRVMATTAQFCAGVVLEHDWAHSLEVPWYRRPFARLGYLASYLSILVRARLLFGYAFFSEHFPARPRF